MFLLIKRWFQSYVSMGGQVLCAFYECLWGHKNIANGLHEVHRLVLGPPGYGTQVGR